MELELINDYRLRAIKARKEAHDALSVIEGSGSRVVLLQDLTKSLEHLPLDIQDYFEEALRCLEIGMRRAPVVFAWAGFFSVFSHKLYHLHKADLRRIRPRWNFSGIEELKESYPEAQIIDAAKAVKLIGKGNLRKYQGQLSERNQCAHPTLYKPTMNVAIGYLDQMVRQTIQYA